jgi:hypothetical protein
MLVADQSNYHVRARGFYFWCIQGCQAGSGLLQEELDMEKPHFAARQYTVEAKCPVT